MKFIWNYIRKEEWSPYVAGMLLGLVGIAAVWASNNLLGASGAFENLAGMIGKAFAPAAFDDMYFNFIMPPGITWGVLLLVGVFFGGMLGAATSGTLLWGKKGAANSSAQWKRIFGPQVWKRWVLAFIGAIILEYAAGIAGGWYVVGTRGVPVHRGHVRFGHSHCPDHLPEPILGLQGDSHA